jgi:hypothetical protein
LSLAFTSTSLIFVGKEGANPNGTYWDTTQWAGSRPANMRLGFKWQTATNTLAYYDTAIIMNILTHCRNKLECISLAFTSTLV